MNTLLSKYPDFIDGYLYRGNLHSRMKKFKLAKQDFEAALKINPRNSMIYIELGKCYEKM